MEGREEERGARMASRLASSLGGVVEEGNEEETRQQGGNRRKKRYDIYLRERREKNTAETRKHAQVYVYTYYLISWRVGCLLHFLLYIIRGYIIYIYIYYITPINVYFSFKVNVCIRYSLLYIDR